MWVCVAFSLLCIHSGGCTDMVNTSGLLLELTTVDFYDKLNAGKMLFIYFQTQVSPTISLFLGELKKSAEVLQDYGILVGKINCNEELIPSHCVKERAPNAAFLFGGGKELAALDLDTVFDVNSIVSEVLFAILRDEMKYVHSGADLLAMEKSCRGKKDMVLAYVSSLGTQEHRWIMETAYVYGSKYQFILITGGPVLKHLGAVGACGVWFLHCRASQSERCPVTPMGTPLSTLGLHTFLQLMEAPLLSEVYEDPSAVPGPPFPYQQTPQVFLFSHPQTEHSDRDTARALAWRLRGLALLVLVHRKSPRDEYNAAYRLPDKSSEVKYLTLPNLDELLELFLHQQEDVQEEKEEEGEDNEDEDLMSDGTLEDEISSGVYEKRGRLVHSDSVTRLTSDRFPAALAQSGLKVLLFYLKWDAVSMAFHSSFVEVAERIAESGVEGVHMSTVDCGEWTDLCASQPAASFPPITAFPTVLLLRPQEPVQVYTGMLGCQALHRFILLSLAASPRVLSTPQEVTSFLHGVPHPALAGSTPHRMLGLFSTRSSSAGVPVFEHAARTLRGRVLSALLTDGPAREWAAERSVDLPAVLLFAWWGGDSHVSVLSLSSSVEDLLSRIEAALLHPLPELTVENLPSFLGLGKALLLLFVGEEEDETGLKQNKALVEDMRRALELGGERMEHGRTPAGMSVLGSYLGSMPPLPALLLTHLPTGPEVYQYPPYSPILARSVLRWLQRVEEARESPAGVLKEGDWPPAVEFYDFLKVMDEEEPGPKDEAEVEEEEEEEEEEEADAAESASEEERSTRSSFHTPDHSEF
ncbi:thioredoxin domain-containing protein 16 isoform X2 [Dunckerocampus dactyliophorus]|uniref:thioredoxin domain-containing protein 16 isoform X2 n=1 Tax=Dunckerocampus dactyliophorus TaxID=161453 RepID=UPI00240530B3|nr:thioredoxin domain-containing protein 16 isoform X2 [Dunckerocampus dactyliophorus]